MAFHDVQLPVDVERGAVGGPRFNTTVVGFGSGFEQRNQEWQLARGEWDLSYGAQNKEDYSSLIEFFVARRGRQHGFRFKDWSDFEATVVQQGIGNGVNKDFQLIKLYTDVASTYTRIISRPILSTLTVFVDAVPQTGGGTDYTLGALGLVTFVVAPAVAEVVTATFEFDLPARFDTDKLDVQLEWYNAGELPDITILELREV